MSHEIVPAGTFLPVRSPSETTSHESVEQLVYVLFKRWRLIGGCLLAFFGAAAIAATSRPLMYSASTKILLKPDRVSLQISNLSPQSAKTPYSTHALQSEIELIRSRDVLRPVAVQLLSENAPPGSEISEAAIDSKVGSLGKSLSLWPVKDTSLIEAELLSESEADAERTLDLIVERYLEHHTLAYSGSGQLLEFYERERAQATAELKAAEDALDRWQAENDVVAVDARIDALLKQQSDLEQRLKETGAAAEMTVQSDPLLARLRGDLLQAEVALADLLQRYTENDRRVREKREQVAMIRSQVAGVEKALAGSVRAQQSSLEEQLRQTGGMLSTLREKKLGADRLTRTVDVARDSFLLYNKQLDEARISANLDRAQLSNIAIVEQPHGSAVNDFDERAGFVILAAIVGLTLGLVSAFVREFFNKTVRTRRDVEVHLGLPVLAAIPDLRARALPDLRHDIAA